MPGAARPLRWTACPGWTARDEPTALDSARCSAATASSRSWAAVAWALCCWPRTRSCSGRSRSSSWPRSWPTTRSSGSASCASRDWRPPSSTPPSCPSTRPVPSMMRSSSPCATCPERTSAPSCGRDGPLTVQRSLAIAAPLADALDAAHRRGLVHRDVKPGNVLVEDDEDERVYLTDFGLTRRSGDVAPWSTAGPLGTLDYMAPEQIERGPIDGRTDQYSLACLIFHCLSGEPPFHGETEAALLYAHVHGAPPVLSERRPELGTAFDAPLMRALAKDPAARFPDCRSLVAVLREAASGKPAVVASRAARGTERRPTVRRPILLGIAALIVLAAIAALASLPPGGGSGAAPSQVAVASDRPLNSGSRVAGASRVGPCPEGGHRLRQQQGWRLRPLPGRSGWELPGAHDRHAAQ